MGRVGMPKGSGSLFDSGSRVEDLRLGYMKQAIPEPVQHAISAALSHPASSIPYHGIVPALHAAIRRYLGPAFYSDNGQVAVGLGARPLIYSVFRSLIAAGDRVLLPSPS